MLGALVHTTALGAAPCVGKPGVWLPGAVEPAARTLPTAAARKVKVAKLSLASFQPDWTEVDAWGQTYTDPTSTAIELPADPAALDALGRIVAGLPGVAAPLGNPADTGWRDTDQYGKDLRWLGAAIFQSMRRWGEDLPQDVQTDDDSGQDWAGWPYGTNHTTRYVYAWNIGADFSVTQALQVQKWAGADSFETHGRPWGWLVYNKWGTDLTFTRTSPSGVFSAGFDLGVWFTQHQCELAGAAFSAFQIGYTALATAVSMGAYGAAAASSLAVAEAVQKGMVGAAQAIDKGDFSTALTALGQIAAQIGSIPFEGATFGSKLAEAVADVGRPLVDNPVTQAVAKLFASSGGGGLGAMLESVGKVAGELKGVVDMTAQKFDAFRKQFDSSTTRHYLALGWNAAHRNDIFGARASVPWYGLADYDLGSAAGAVAVVQSGGALDVPRKASRLRLETWTAASAASAAAFAPSSLLPRQAMPKPAGLPSSGAAWLVGAGVVGAAALGAIYTAPGRRVVQTVAGVAKRALAQPPKLLALEALALAAVGATIYAATRPAAAAAAPSTPAPAAPSAEAMSVALRR